jgi:GT2 family glycosyltransferase
VPRVTVVVPTFRRPALLAHTMAALAVVEPPNGDFEIVVVDDGSGANYAQANSDAVAQASRARLLTRENAGPAAARNLGYRAGSGELIAFLDDDCAPRPSWLRELVAAFDGEDKSLGAVGGRVVSAPATNWVMRFLAATDYSTGLQPVFENAATANACYRRTVLDELGGFDEGFRYPGGDDPDLSVRARQAGYRLAFVPEAIVEHHELSTYGDFVSHMYKRGVGEARLAAKQGRGRRVLARAVMLPVFLLRTGVGTWRRTAGKGGGAVTRIAWIVLESWGRVAFVAGSVRGLIRS